MAAQTQQTPWERVRGIHLEWARFYELAGGGSVFLILGVLGLLIFESDRLSYSMNTYTELLSVALTILVLDRRAKHREERERKEELIFQMGGNVNSTALSAARMLRYKGWLQDGNLEGTNLRQANLEGAQLGDANLQNADLQVANLRDADLRDANLEGAVLKDADLEGADLKDANLQKARLIDTNLKGATLPDDTEWTPDTDMTRFTDREHPEFWQPSEDKN